MKNFDEILESQKVEYMRLEDAKNTEVFESLISTMLNRFSVTTTADLSKDEYAEYSNLLESFVDKDTKIVNEKGHKYMNDNSIVLCESSTAGTIKSFFESNICTKLSNDKNIENIITRTILHTTADTIEGVSKGSLRECFSDEEYRTLVKESVQKSLDRMVGIITDAVLNCSK